MRDGTPRVHPEFAAQDSHPQRWPTDWSKDFEAGREWWGAFAWTIEDVRAGWITVVWASTTD